MSIGGCRAITKSPGCATHQGKCSRPTEPGKRGCEFPGAWVSSVSSGDRVTQKGRNNTSGSSSRRSAGSSSISGRQLSSGVVVYVSSPRSQCEVFRIESAVCARSPVRGFPHRVRCVRPFANLDGRGRATPLRGSPASPASAPVVLQQHPDLQQN